MRCRKAVKSSGVACMRNSFERGELERRMRTEVASRLNALNVLDVQNERETSLHALRKKRREVAARTTGALEETWRRHNIGGGVERTLMLLQSMLCVSRRIPGERGAAVPRWRKRLAALLARRPIECGGARGGTRGEGARRGLTRRAKSSSSTRRSPTLPAALSA